MLFFVFVIRFMEGSLRVALNVHNIGSPGWSESNVEGTRGVILREDVVMDESGGNSLS